MKHKRSYTVSRDKSGVWYAHKICFSWIPIAGSFSTSKKKAQGFAAAAMGLTLDEYLKYTE